ncbi:polysaccharide biosynthesis protein [Rhodonellum psychrophilum GCM71 = DSM 17998]|uniref:Polysaccharide biosynthesis protein n=2 Tax=Rhodonellum TaxID=336827 RepID=U5BV20_9BACT|nr:MULTISPECIES: polysaccharide biosynthesis C-terminal domain-containing protein [Rhodonellum]ERM84490.1 polysaccharide biosynthesis protein [Rhodonellum psychrophilum GCM71 = DSM 17998]MDO9551349.1 polysaccharide biosynthesis C-terminal domain-containing protein [Rhodonellum sp.]SDZ01306.1 Membrane protein involved in the export of O-antigen and teichoic acid [Rhodonellum ikkaensis]
MSQLKKLAGQTAVYGISSILGKTINFLLLPLYIVYLDKEALGSFTNFYAFIAFLNIVFTYGMETAFFRFSTGKGLDPKKVYGQVQSLLMTTSLVLGALIYFSAPQLSIWLGYEGQEFLFRWMAWILAIDAVLAIPYAKLRVENKSLTFALSKLGNILFNIGFNIFFIAICFHIWKGEFLTELRPLVIGFYNPEWGFEYILLSNLIANALMIPILFYFGGKFKLGFDKKFIAPMWQYAIPLFFMGLAGVTNEVFSRWLFEYVIPENFYPGLTPREAGGIFGANFRLAIFMSLIIQAFKFAAEPFFFNQSTEKNSPELFARVMHAFVIFCCTLMIVVSVNLDIIGKLILIKADYIEAMVMVPVLLLGYLFLGIYFNLSIWFKLTDQTKYSFYITLVGAIVTILVIFTLVPLIGYMGGALSTLACYLTMSAICYFYGQKYFFIPYQTGKSLFYLALAFGLSYGGFFLEVDQVVLQFLGRNILVLIFVLVVLLIEKEEIKKLLARQKPKRL